MRPTTRGLALRPAAIINAGILFLLIYAGLLGINLRGADAQIREVERLSILEAEAAALRGEISNFVFLDGRFASRRELNPNQIALITQARDQSRDKAAAIANRLHAFLDLPGASSIETLLDDLTAASNRRAELQEQINRPDVGLLATFVAARTDADRVFTDVSEKVALPTADYLAARTAQNEFLGNLIEARALEANRALVDFTSRTVTFPGLTPTQRKDLAIAADRYLQAFKRLSEAHIEFRAIGEHIQAQLTDIVPTLDRLEADVPSKVGKLRVAASNTRRTLEIGTAGVAALAALVFAALASGAYSRVQANDLRLRQLGDRFRDFARASSDVFWDFDANGSLTEVLGDDHSMLSRGFTPGLSLREWADQLGLDVEYISGLFERRAGFRELEHVIEIDDKIRWYASSGVPTYDTAGIFQGLRCASREITEEKLIAADHVLAEQRLSSIVENLPIALFRVEGSITDARFTFVSANAAKIIGQSAESLVALHLRGDHQFVIEEDRRQFTQEINQGLQQNGAGASRARVRLADGSLRWVQQICRRVPPTHPTAPRAVEGLWIDVTAEEARLRQITDFAEAIDSTNQAIYIVNRKTREITYQSRGYGRLFGLSEADLEKRRYTGQLGRLLGREMDDLIAEVEAAVDSPEGWRGEFSYQLHDGRIKHLLGNSRALADDRRVMVVTDITHRVEQEHDLLGFRTALDHAGDGILIFGDLTKPITYANDAIRRIMRLPQDVSLEGRYIHEFMPTRRGPLLDLRDYLTKELTEKNSIDTQLEGLRADGSPIIANLRATLLPDGRLLLAVSDVTQSMFLEREVRARREELARLVSNLPGVAYRMGWTEAGYVPSFVGPRISEFSGYPGQTAVDVGPDGTPLLSVGDRDMRRQAMAEARLHGGAYEVVWRMMTRSGEARWIMERGEHVVLPEGGIVAEGYLTDVTREVMARRASERRARVMTDLGTDKELPLLDSADAMQRIARAAAEGLEVPRASIWLLSEGSDDMMALATYDARTKVGHSGQVVPIKSHSGYLAHLAERHAVVAPIVEEHPAVASFVDAYFAPAGVRSVINIPIVRDNRTIGVLACEDTTARSEWLAEEVQFAAHLADFAALILESVARRKTLHELARTNHRLTEVVRALDSTQDQILIQDSERTITYANRSALELVGAPSLRDVAGRRTLEVLLSQVDDIANVATELNKAVAAGTPWSREVVFQSPRLGQRQLEVRVSALEAGGVIYAATDVTERRQREADQHVLRRQLSDAQRLEAIGSLAGGIAHDFNNIIGATRGFADLLVSDLERGSNSHRYAERIVAACRRAAALVKEIMAFSRVKDAEHTTIAVGDILTEAQDVLLSRPDKNLNLELLNNVGDTWIKANASQITQVLSNLLINAADATGITGTIQLIANVLRPDNEMLADFARDGIVTPSLSVTSFVATQGSLRPKSDYVCIAIVDHGVGMTETVLAHIFEPFYTTKEKSRGTGLGLAVVAGIVEAHHGAIRVITRPGVGTTFEIYLPQAKGRATVAAPKTAVSPAGELRGRERVLIVDDESDLAESLAIALARLGYETAPIFHPQEALEIFAEDPAAWDVVISDQSMPKMKGIELIRKIKALCPGLRTIVCTGYSDSLDAERTMAEGVDAFFHKPVTADVLARTIRGLFS